MCLKCLLDRFIKMTLMDFFVMAAPSSWSLEIMFVCYCIASQTNAFRCISDTLVVMIA